MLSISSEECWATISSFILIYIRDVLGIILHSYIITICQMGFLQTRCNWEKSLDQYGDFNKINLKTWTIQLDDRSHYRSRIGEKLCFRWESFHRPPFGDGESSGGRFHTDSSSESRCRYLLWTWTGSFINFSCTCGRPLDCWLLKIC